MRLELTRSCDHYPLKVACIPISPPALASATPCTGLKKRVFPSKYPGASLMCPEQDSNLHTSRHAHLKRTRLPIPPSGQKKRSGKRDSNSRPRPWQGRALPTELFPLTSFYYLKDRLPSVRTPLFALLVVLFSKAGAKVLLFSDIRKFFGKKMQKKCKKVYFMPNQGMQAGL